MDPTWARPRRRRGGNVSYHSLRSSPWHQSKEPGRRTVDQDPLQTRAMNSRDTGTPSPRAYRKIRTQRPSSMYPRNVKIKQSKKMNPCDQAQLEALGKMNGRLPLRHNGAHTLGRATRVAKTKTWPIKSPYPPKLSFKSRYLTQNQKTHLWHAFCTRNC